jgi:hypothetical protein
VTGPQPVFPTVLRYVRYALQRRQCRQRCAPVGACVAVATRISHCASRWTVRAVILTALTRRITTRTGSFAGLTEKSELILEALTALKASREVLLTFSTTTQSPYSRHTVDSLLKMGHPLQSLTQAVPGGPPRRPPLALRSHSVPAPPR